jgi:hypothetical protein
MLKVTTFHIRKPGPTPDSSCSTINPEVLLMAISTPRTLISKKGWKEKKFLVKKLPINSQIRRRNPAPYNLPAMIWEETTGFQVSQLLMPPASHPLVLFLLMLPRDSMSTGCHATVCSQSQLTVWVTLPLANSHPFLKSSAQPPYISGSLAHTQAENIQRTPSCGSF